MKCTARMLCALSTIVGGATAQAPQASSDITVWGLSRLSTAIYRLQDIDRIACGSFNILAVRASGELLAWGDNLSGQCDAPMPSAPWQHVAAGPDYGVGTDRNGQGFTWGYGQAFPALPAGISCRGLSAGDGFFLVLRSDGQITGTALSGRLAQVSVPVLPPGVTYTEISSGQDHTLALRSDGSVVAWGDNSAWQCQVPVLPPGTQYTWVATGPFTSFAGRSDGSVIAWGSASGGTAPVPQPPAGLSFQRVDAGYQHGIGLLSDGSVMTWGIETNGARQVPALPTGMRYVEALAAGRHSVVRRSDGHVFVFGADNTFQVGLPALPGGVRYVDMDIGGPCIALDSTGTVHVTGSSDPSATVAPALPVGVRYVAVAAGSYHLLALGSDRQVRAWGVPFGNTYGQRNIPVLPPGIGFVAVTASPEASYAIRSDGQLECFGRNDMGQCNAPPPGPGRGYVEVSANSAHALGRLSDGSVVAWGNNFHGQLTVPALPAGLEYVEVDAGSAHSLARRSDGAVVGWGWNAFGQVNVPQFPPGVWCVELAAGSAHSVARLSDGTLRIWGGTGPFQSAANSLPLPARHWQEIEASSHVAGRTGPESSYVRFGSGCAGSMPVAELVPLATPRIDGRFEVTLTNLPHNAALLGAGLSTTTSAFGPLPLPLAPLGMPGCTAHISWDAGVFVAGADHYGRVCVDIPNAAALVGLRFYHQAIVLDPTANAAGLVVSDATVAVVGQ